MINVDLLIEKLADPIGDDEGHCLAAVLLAGAGRSAKKAEPGLIKAFRQAQGLARMTIPLALAAIGPSLAALDALIGGFDTFEEFLHPSSMSLRPLGILTLVRAIGSLSDVKKALPALRKKAIPALRQLENDKSVSVREAARAAIRRITAKSA